MAKRKTKRAPKPKVFEIDGHQLSEAMHWDYTRCLEARLAQKTRRTLAENERFALDDFLSGYRPSRKMEHELIEATKQAVGVSIAIGTMHHYSWFEVGSIRANGCELVKKLALDLYYASAKLTALAGNVATEDTTKLQDWLAQDNALDRIGAGGVPSHG